MGFIVKHGMDGHLRDGWHELLRQVLTHARTSAGRKNCQKGSAAPKSPAIAQEGKILKWSS